MMKKLVCFLLLLSACKKEMEPLQAIDHLEQPAQQNQNVKMTIPDQISFTVQGLYPEGVAFDKFNDRFLVSSFGRGTIGAVSYHGQYSPFIHDPALKSTLGLHIDEARKRVVTAVTDGLSGDVAKLGVYDLQTGNRIWLIDLAPLHPGGIHLADDLAIDPQGNIYVTDAKSPVIYKVDKDGRASVFFENQYFAMPPGFAYYWVGFNGIVYDNNGFLIVAFYAGSFVGKPSLVRIPVNNPQDFSGVNLDFPVAYPEFSPDGLLLSRNGKDLIVVDNKFSAAPGEIVHLTSNDHWASAKRIEAFPTGFTSPATATTDGKDVYVIYSYLSDIFFGTPGSNTEFMIQKIPFENIQGF